MAQSVCENFKIIKNMWRKKDGKKKNCFEEIRYAGCDAINCKGPHVSSVYKFPCLLFVAYLLTNSCMHNTRLQMILFPWADSFTSQSSYAPQDLTLEIVVYIYIYTCSWKNFIVSIQIETKNKKKKTLQKILESQ